jgi:hypothetical protein
MEQRARQADRSGQWDRFYIIGQWKVRGGRIFAYPPYPFTMLNLGPTHVQVMRHIRYSAYPPYPFTMVNLVSAHVQVLCHLRIRDQAVQNCPRGAADPEAGRQRLANTVCLRVQV